MPYRIRRGHPDCAGYAVVNTDTGKVAPGGCHPSKKDAVKHLRVLYKHVGDASMQDLALNVQFADVPGGMMGVGAAGVVFDKLGDPESGPFGVQPDHPACPAGNPHAVTDSQGDPVGCFASPEEAAGVAETLNEPAGGVQATAAGSTEARCPVCANQEAARRLR